jgi:anionic cell wall polymer biosynthesis LytR-Cps2A-Psr (LCP) family protein
VTTFDGFRQAVDAVDGVVIDVARPITDHDYPNEGEGFMPVYIPAGRQLMHGEQALEYVRSRHDDPIGDFGRNQRQQAFLKAMMAKLLQPQRIGQFNQFLDIAKASLRTNLSPDQIISLGTSLLAGAGHVQGYAVGPNYTRDPTTSEFAAYVAVLIPNRTAIARLVKTFVDGTPPPAEPTPSP